MVVGGLGVGVDGQNRGTRKTHHLRVGKEDGEFLAGRAIGLLQRHHIRRYKAMLPVSNPRLMLEIPSQRPTAALGKGCIETHIMSHFLCALDGASSGAQACPALPALRMQTAEAAVVQSAHPEPAPPAPTAMASSRCASRSRCA